MPDMRPGPIQLARKLGTRLRRRGPGEVARLALTRLQEAQSSEDRLVMLVRDTAEAGRAATGDVGLSFRRARPQDGAAYARWIGTDSPASFRARLSERTRCYLVADGPRLLHASWVTTAGAWTRELRTYLCPPSGDAYLYESFTRADARGRGAYPLALEGVRRELSAEGSARVWVAVEADNPASLKAVGKVGFAPAFEIGYRRRWGRLRVDEASGDMVGTATDFVGCGGEPPRRQAPGGPGFFKRSEQ
ncbi:MAG: hypothetical protein ACRDJ5_11585 [Actinomycetota bacterium]